MRLRNKHGVIMRRLAGLLFFVMMSALCLAQDTSHTFYQAKKALYTWNVSEFEDLIRTASDETLKLPDKSYLEALYFGIHFLMFGDQQDYSDFNQSYSAFTEHSSHNYASAIRESEITLLKAVLLYYQSNDIRAFGMLSKAYKLADHCLKEKPEYIESYKIMALVLSVFSRIPEDYQWTLKLMGINRNPERAVDYLNKYEHNMKDSWLLETEWLIFKPLLLYFTSGEEDCVDYMDAKLDELNRTPLASYVYSTVYLFLNQAERSAKVLNECKEDRFFPYMYLNLGKVKLYRGDPDAASCFKTYIRSYRGDQYLKTAYLFLYRNALLNGEFPDNYRENVLNKGSSFLYSDRQAEKEVQNKDLLPRDILRARMYFDGGYYHKADSILESNRNKLLSGSAECRARYYYRKARIMQETGHEEEAIEAYTYLLKSSDMIQDYIIPYGALQLAKMHESRGDNEKAIACYTIAKKYNKYTYQYSIKREVKRAFERLKS